MKKENICIQFEKGDSEYFEAYMWQNVSTNRSS